MVGLSRRRFLGAAAALAAALLGACGRDEARKPPESDADVLVDLMGREQRALAAVRGVPGAGGIARQDQQHLARLSMLTGVAALDPQSPPSGDLQAALARKQEAMFAYVEALPRLADPDLRVLAMQIAASEAEHLAALRLADGDEPVPDAFAGFTEGSAP